MCKADKTWFVYLLECVNGKIYTGITTNVTKRFQKHQSGKGAKFTKSNPPSHILVSKKCDNRSQASKMEYQIKQLTATQKRALNSEWSND
ncbi:MAG: GIY-YIG nuclease family protein [Methylococcaceae bacterium]|nr:GIY-YIG nuclease family protein [Methylococcaceae bacterium]